MVRRGSCKRPDSADLDLPRETVRTLAETLLGAEAHHLDEASRDRSESKRVNQPNSRRERCWKKRESAAVRRLAA